MHACGRASRSGPTLERLFVQMLGVGLDAQVVHAISPRLKRLLGKGAYVAQTMREMGRYRYPGGCGCGWMVRRRRRRA